MSCHCRWAKWNFPCQWKLSCCIIHRKTDTFLNDNGKSQSFSEMYAEKFPIMTRLTPTVGGEQSGCNLFMELPSHAVKLILRWIFHVQKKFEADKEEIEWTSKTIIGSFHSPPRRCFSPKTSENFLIRSERNNNTYGYGYVVRVHRPRGQ